MSADPPPDGERPPPPADPPRLSLGVRLLLWATGGALLVIGIAGLVLPGIQGILTIAAGVAVLSLASETAYLLLRKSLGGWPGLMERIERLRQRIHDRLHRGRDRSVDK